MSGWKNLARKLTVMVLFALISSSVLASNRTVLVLGDSLSAAYNLPEEEGWVALLAQRLASEDISVVNASVSGATTAAGLQLLPELLQSHRPELLVLELGANDGLQGKPLVYIRRNLQRLIQSAQAQGVEVVLVGIRIPPNYGAAYTEPFFEQYAELAEQFELALVPFLLEGVAGNPELMMSDRLHPVAKAQPVLLENVWPVLAGRLDLSTDSD